jgi:hypothetical protein
MRPPHAAGQTQLRSARPAPDEASLFRSRHIPSRREQEARSILRDELAPQICGEAALPRPRRSSLSRRVSASASEPRPRVVVRHGSTVPRRCAMPDRHRPQSTDASVKTGAGCGEAARGQCGNHRHRGHDHAQRHHRLDAFAGGDDRSGLIGAPRRPIEPIRP